MGASGSFKEELNIQDFQQLLNISQNKCEKNLDTSQDNINKIKEEIIPHLNSIKMDILKEKIELILKEEDNIVFYEVLIHILQILQQNILKLIKNSKCPSELRIPLDSVIYAATRLPIQELKKFRDKISEIYGSEYISHAVNNEDNLINEVIIEKLKRNMILFKYPESLIKEKIKQLCIENNIDYNFICDKNEKGNKNKIRRGKTISRSSSSNYEKNNDKKDRDKIIKKGEKIFSSFDKNIDKKCYKINNIKNWSESFYNLKTGIILEKYIEILSKSEFNKFFEALNYEYGVNKCPLDTKKAFEIYKKAADTSTDTLSMYRLYHIYKKDFKKFNIEKRNHVLELFYIMKCFTYLTPDEKDEYLFQRFNIKSEVETLLLNDDNRFYEWYSQYIDFLNENYEIYNLNKDDIDLIECIIYYYFEEDNEESRIYMNNKMSSLINNKNNPEAIYNAITYFGYEKDLKLDYYKILYDMNYYRSYSDYADLLSSKKEGLNILKESISKGYYSHINCYIGLYMNDELNEIFKSHSVKSDFIFILKCLLDNIIVDKIKNLFEFVYMRKILIKHFNFGNEFKIHLDNVLKEYMKYFKKFISQNDEENKKLITNCFIRDKCYQVIYSIFGYIYYHGINGIVEKNYNKTLKLFDYLIKNKEDFYGERFYLYHIYCIKDKQRLNKIKENKKNKNKDNSKKKNDNKDLKELHHKLLNLYYESLSPKEIKLTPPPIFYVLSKLNRRKAITKGDIILEYVFLNRASNAEIKDSGDKIFIQKYIKYKAKKKVKEKNKEKNYKKIKNAKGAINTGGYGEDGKICPICLTNKKSIIALPCRHFFCSVCMDKLLEKGFCPICRTEIKITFDMNLKKEFLVKTLIKKNEDSEEDENEEENEGEDGNEDTDEVESIEFEG